MKKAGHAYEAAEEAKKAVGSFGQTPGSKKDTTPGESSSSTPKGKGKSKDTPPKSNTEEKTRKYPKRFSSFKEATKGVPPELVKERLKEKKCTRCGKKGHGALFCAGEAVTTVTPKDPKVASSSANATSKPAPKVTQPEPAVSATIQEHASPQGFIRELDDDYELDIWPVDSREQSVI
ncbi:MAG: hypothetical protein DME65_14255 [Verrucomicrobia bacterium]|nr:MAG: hypothetical protein DME65_14255 [Verrucomicrobiota bacterium]